MVCTGERRNESHLEQDGVHVCEREGGQWNGEVRMQGVEVAEIGEFKYLGLISNREYGQEMMKKRVQAGRSGWRCVRSDMQVVGRDGSG